LMIRPGVFASPAKRPACEFNQTFALHILPRSFLLPPDILTG
jgi:hypothetical protein